MSETFHVPCINSTLWSGLIEDSNTSNIAQCQHGFTNDPLPVPAEPGPLPTMSDTNSIHEHEPPSPARTYRIPGLKNFLQLSADDSKSSISTRGQALPGLISSRSATHIPSLKEQHPKQRRRSSIDAEESGRRSADTLDGHDLELGRRTSFVPVWGDSPEQMDDRRMSLLMTPQMRSQRLIGNSNPRYRWEQYYTTEERLNKMRKPIRQYYERCNHLIQHYLYIDRLLDSSLPHNLIQEYNHGPGAHDWYTGTPPEIPVTITEESTPDGSPKLRSQRNSSVNLDGDSNGLAPPKVHRTKDLYRIKPDDENTPLLTREATENDETGNSDEVQIMPPDFSTEEDSGTQSRVVTIAINLNLAANLILLILKIVVVALSSSVSVLASLVDAALDFLSTAIIWTTARLIASNDSYAYPIGRRRLEPVGVLVFSIVMITSFVQVALEGLQKLTGPDDTIVRLTIPAIAIMAATVIIKFLCWLYCRLIPNSSVQALAQDAMTDVVFNTFSIIFPLFGYYFRIWWLDPLGGILLSLYVILNWSATSSTHIRNLTGAAASADERNILLYLTMRFAKTVKQIQGLQAYHSGDKLMVEVDVVLDEGTNLRDSHDLGESLQYVLESVPNVDRAFVHLDYAGWNLPSHMRQD